MNININETELFDNLIVKVDLIKDKLIKMKNYSESFDNNKQISYLEKLVEFNNGLNNLDAVSKDIYEEYIIQSDPSLLSNEDKNNQKNLLINKKIQNIFLPYMLYLQILLSNNPDN
jgi:hypothetical protein